MLQTFQPKIEALRDKKRVRPKLIEFDEMPFKSGTFRPEFPKQKEEYVVIIVVREGPGIPLLSKGSHLPGASIPPCLPVDGLTEKSVLIFNGRIGRQEPGFTGVGSRVITTLYE
jgi:hypothetical protein